MRRGKGTRRGQNGKGIDTVGINGRSMTSALF